MDLLGWKREFHGGSGVWSRHWVLIELIGTVPPHAGVLYQGFYTTVKMELDLKAKRAKVYMEGTITYITFRRLAGAVCLLENRHCRTLQWQRIFKQAL